MNAGQLKRRVDSLSKELVTPQRTETRLDLSSFSESEQHLFCRIREMAEKYGSELPPNDVLEKNRDLVNKCREVFGRRIIDVFVQSVPALLLCDELERWYFKLYYYNFWLDCIDKLKQLREMPEERRMTVISDYKGLGVFDIVFRFQKDALPSKEAVVEC